MVAAPSPAPAEQAAPDDAGGCEDNDDLSSEEVINLQPTQSEADCSLLREEVENILNSTSLDELNVEKVL
eukprot:1101407-Ditylum_brightwellii.AAC.1